MFSKIEIQAVMSDADFTRDVAAVRQSLVNHRLLQPVLIPAQSEWRLGHFVEAVLASAPEWTPAERSTTCRIAAEIAETLAARFSKTDDGRPARIKSALLYELAALPALSAAMIQDGDLPPVVLSFFRRMGMFSVLNGTTADGLGIGSASVHLGELALVDDSLRYIDAAQRDQATPLADLASDSVSAQAGRIGTSYDIGLSASELNAFSKVVLERSSRTTVISVSPSLMPILRDMSFPVELLPAQSAAVNGGLLNRGLPSWGFAAPTGSGKTFLARLLIADVLTDNPDTKVIYLVPSKALVSEVAFDLNSALKEIDHRVLALSAQLVDLDDREMASLDDASVVVMTPEKADLLLRLGADFLNVVGLAVVDEAHHIESGTRGALLELYLWRLKRLLPSYARYVFLSAVAPNIGDITRWMDPHGKAVVFETRPTRMRVGIYQVSGRGRDARGTIRYADNTSVEVVSSSVETSIRRGICQLASFLHPAGPVLVVAKGKKECETIANELQEWLRTRDLLVPLSDEQQQTDTYRSLDARLEREMYTDVPLRMLLRNRIAYHHAGLPPNVRESVERAIRQRLIDYVVATTTLAEGVNFPFSSVIVQSLALKEPPEKGRPSRYAPVTPRTFWNIAGRAGRPGFDAEGQVILFERALGLDKIHAVLEDYTNPEITSLAPVGSALAEALKEIETDLAQGTYSAKDLTQVALPSNMSRRTRGAINLVRVGILHARAANLIHSPEEIVESSFAAQFLHGGGGESAKAMFRTQSEATDAYLASGDAPSLEKLAELGLSLETLTNLREYVRQMETWQLENLQTLFYGGTVNLNQAPFIVGPVAKRMSELEGPALGGFLSDVIVRWLAGVTFTSIRSEAGFQKRLEDLIAVIYSRVQYLLPWGLWATDWLLEQESLRREINYDNQVKNLAYLADAGVPSFDALRLTQFGIERVDATRLSRAYKQAGGSDTGLDCVHWVTNQSTQSLSTIVQGQDDRRLEHRFFERLRAFREGARDNG